MKFLYIFPGFQDSTKRAPYQLIRREASKIGYSVMCVPINWNIPLSRQLFIVQDNSVLIGFSMGAVFARLLSQKNKVSLIIQTSMTPLQYFTKKELFKEISEAIGPALSKDILKNLSPIHNAKKTISLSGDKEVPEKGDIIVKNTGHTLTKNYIDEILRLL